MQSLSALYFTYIFTFSEGFSGGFSLLGSYSKNLNRSLANQKA